MKSFWLLSGSFPRYYLHHFLDVCRWPSTLLLFSLFPLQNGSDEGICLLVWLRELTESIHKVLRP